MSSLRQLVGASYCWIAVTAVGNVKREMLKHADGTVSTCWIFLKLSAAATAAFIKPVEIHFYKKLRCSVSPKHWIKVFFQLRRISCVQFFRRLNHLVSQTSCISVAVTRCAQQPWPAAVLCSSQWDCCWWHWLGDQSVSPEAVRRARTSSAYLRR